MDSYVVWGKSDSDLIKDDEIQALIGCLLMSSVAFCFFHTP